MKLRFFCLFILVFVLGGCAGGQVFYQTEPVVYESGNEINETMFQFFNWNYPADQSLWNFGIQESAVLAELGITSVWLPPAFKGGGTDDAGYGSYDLYDLGEFLQKGTVPTKYGTKDEYLGAIKEFRKNGIKVYADITLNHKGWAEGTKTVKALSLDPQNRNKTVSGKSLDSPDPSDFKEIEAWCVFNFEGRNNKYSDFKWNSSHFDGVDWDQKTNSSGIFLFEGKSWDPVVSTMTGNPDYAMFADYDMENPEVVKELISWGKWYTEFTGIDGYRLDAVKHISKDFYRDWIGEMRKEFGDMFIVAEYWAGTDEMLEWWEYTGSYCHLFDFELQGRLGEMERRRGLADIRTLFDSKLYMKYPENSVSFIENHDTQVRTPGVPSSHDFRIPAYAFILTRIQSVPCVFFGDYYGIPGILESLKDDLDVLLAVRRDRAYGTQRDYSFSEDIIGWTREGTKSRPDSGVAVLMNDNARSSGAVCAMYVGDTHAGEIWKDVVGKGPSVVIDEFGYGNFAVSPRSCSVYIKE